MKTSLIAIAAALACSLGCEGKSNPKIEPDRPAVEVHVPGVDVKVDRDKGVDVKAPGVDVETTPDNGAEVKVDAGEPK